MGMVIYKQSVPGDPGIDLHRVAGDVDPGVDQRDIVPPGHLEKRFGFNMD